MTTYFPYPGPPPKQTLLAPDQSIGGPEDVVLRGSWVRVGTTLLHQTAIPIRSGVAFHTRAIRVHLLPPGPPAVQVNAGAGGPSATIAPPAGVHGLPQAVWYADCGGTNFNQWIYFPFTTKRVLAVGPRPGLYSMGAAPFGLRYYEEGWLPEDWLIYRAASRSVSDGADHMADYYVEEQDDDGSLVIAGPFATRAEAEAVAGRTAADPRAVAGGGHSGEATEITSNGRSYDVVEVDPPTTGKDLLAALRAMGFLGMWADRDDLGETTAFARELRSRAETRE